MWGSPRVGKLEIFITPLLNKSARHRAHYAEKKAEKQHDIDANGDRGGVKGLIVRDGRVGAGRWRL
jgi:hypothetical protein